MMEIIRIEEVIVAGTEYFLIPKYNGIKDIPEELSAIKSVREVLSVNISSVIGSLM